MEKCVISNSQYIFPILTLILGALLTFLAGLKSASVQREEDRKDSKSKLLRDEIVDLQFAIDELYSSLHRALLINNDPVRAALWGLKVGEGAAWQERFESADRKVRVLASHVSDDELQTRIDRFRDLTVRMLGGPIEADKLDDTLKPLLRALLDVHDYAGKRYNELT